MVVVDSFQHEEVLGMRFAYKLTGKPKLYAHIYFVDGLLIDTGQRNMRKHILPATAKLAVDQMFITHHHEDHSGNIPQIRAQHGCQVYASELCCQMMKAPPPISLAQKITWGDRPAYTDLTPVSGSIQTPQFRFDILPIPGHAPDMVALYEPTKKWLFSADLYLNSYIDYFMRAESMADQIESIQKILRLDFKELFCSHKPQLQHGREKLEKKLHFLKTFFAQVAEQYAKGYAAREIFKRLDLKENSFIKTLSTGALSKMNMVKSVIRDLERGFQPL